MFSSLRFRLWLSYVVIAGVVITIATISLAIYLLRNPINDRRELQRLRLLSNLLVQRNQALNLPLGMAAAGRLPEIVQRIDEASQARVALYNANGELLADSRSGNATALPEFLELSQRRANVAPIFRDAARSEWIYTLTRLDNGGYLLLATPRIRLAWLGILRDEFLGPMLRSLALAMGLSVLLALWIAGWITAPLQRLAQGVQAVSTGKFKPVPLEGPGEVQSVARSFNEMGERVQATQRSQRDFIANVSHDLKTPLTSIQGFAQAILDGTASDSQAAAQSAQVIYDEAERMRRMVQDLLELARLDSGSIGFERAGLDLGRLLVQVAEKFSPQANQTQVSLTLTTGYSPSSPVIIIGDPDRLTQVFTNLVDNALKFTPAGGQVAISLRQVDDWVEVSMQDTGPGVPTEELERIFERFYQTDKSRSSGRRGVGLGLAIAREIIQAHGGSIAAYNLQALNPASPASGSVFVVRLPVVRPDDSTLARRRKDMARA